MALCKFYKQLGYMRSLGFRLGLIGVISALSLQALAAPTAPTATAKSQVHEQFCEALLVPFTKVENREYAGLTAHGLKELKQIRDSLRYTDGVLKAELKNLGSATHAGYVSRLASLNTFLYGPPGGAKSLVISWLLKAESTEAFKLQLHQMITEQAFTGGQDFEAAKKGEYLINSEGSLSSYVVALIDEVDKGNPAALSNLLSLLNERKILNGGHVVDALTETVFATSNATLPEIFQQFKENGLETTAPALLNRFQIKMFIYNWLSKEHRSEITERAERKRYLEALSHSDPSVLEDEVFNSPKEVNWKAARMLARSIIAPGRYFRSVYQDLVQELRDKTTARIRESESLHRSDSQNEPFVYFPSADYNTRLVEKIPDSIIMSVFVDFLLSPLADDENLENMTASQIVLDPLSLWRGYLMMTTVGPGTAKLVFNEEHGRAVDIDFDWDIDVGKARDTRESKMIENLQSEQRRFAETFFTLIEDFQIELERAAKYKLGQFKGLPEEASIEQLLLIGR